MTEPVCISNQKIFNYEFKAERRKTKNKFQSADDRHKSNLIICKCKKKNYLKQKKTDKTFSIYSICKTKQFSNHKTFIPIMRLTIRFDKITQIRISMIISIWLCPALYSFQHTFLFLFVFFLYHRFYPCDSAEQASR